MTFDQIDLKIINHLTQDGRASGEKIAHDMDTQTFICFDESASRSQWVPRGLAVSAEDELSENLLQRAAVHPVDRAASRRPKRCLNGEPDWKQILIRKSNQERLAAIAQRDNAEFSWDESLTCYPPLG